MTTSSEPKTKGVATRGVLVALEEKTSKTGKAYVVGKIDAVKMDGTVIFTRSFIAFKDEAVEALKTMGIGARVYAYGYFDKREVDGGKSTRQSYRVIDARVNTPRDTDATTETASIDS